MIEIHIATNHSDLGGILPIFMQYSAIPIGMTVFRQNLKSMLYYCENHTQKGKAFHRVKYVLCKRCILSNIVSVILLPVKAFVIGWVAAQ